jgi:hypothetical protein
MKTSTGNPVRALAVLVAATSVQFACNDVQSPGPPGSPTLAHVRILMSRSLAPAASAAMPLLAVSGQQAQIAVSNVSLLTVTVTGIQCLSTDSALAADSGWMDVTLDTPVTLDLLALPTADSSPVVIASGMLPEGSYTKVRLRVDDAHIMFVDDMTVGNASFTADTDYLVTIPSGPQTGIKTDVQFDVAADSAGTVIDVPLLFDPAATFVNATATGSGKVILAPVIKARSAGR